MKDIFKSKTFRLDADNDPVMYGYTRQGITWQEYAPGNVGLLLEYYHELTGKSDWLMKLDNIGGAPGNLDRNDLKYHGWRGTTNNVALYAHGLRRITKAVYEERYGRVYLKVTVGKDLAEDKE